MDVIDLAAMERALAARPELSDARDAGQTVTLPRALVRRLMADGMFAVGVLNRAKAPGVLGDHVMRRSAALEAELLNLATLAEIRADEDLDD